VLDLIPNARDMRDLEELCEILKVCKEVSVFLQHRDPLKVPIQKARALFDALIADYPDMAHHLAPDSDIVHNKVWESAVMKLQMKEEHSLTPAEKKVVRIFKVDATTAARDAAAAPLSYVDRAIAGSKAQKVSQYITSPLRRIFVSARSVLPS
jgi:hypothetical protein